eukprot:UN01715
MTKVTTLNNKFNTLLFILLLLLICHLSIIITVDATQVLSDNRSYTDLVQLSTGDFGECIFNFDSTKSGRYYLGCLYGYKHNDINIDYDSIPIPHCVAGAGVDLSTITTAAPIIVGTSPFSQNPTNNPSYKENYIGVKIILDYSQVGDDVQVSKGWFIKCFPTTTSTPSYAASPLAAQFKTSDFDWRDTHGLTNIDVPVKLVHVDPKTSPFIITAQYTTTSTPTTLTLNILGMEAVVSGAEFVVVASPALPVNSLSVGTYQFTGECTGKGFTVASSGTSGRFKIEPPTTTDITWVLCDMLSITFNIATPFTEGSLIKVVFPSFSSVEHLIKPQPVGGSTASLPSAEITPPTNTPTWIAQPLIDYTFNLATLVVRLPQRVAAKAKAINFYSRPVTPYLDAFMYNQWYSANTPVSRSVLDNAKHINFGGLNPNSVLNQNNILRLQVSDSNDVIAELNTVVFFSGLSPHRTTNIRYKWFRHSSFNSK